MQRLARLHTVSASRCRRSDRISQSNRGFNLLEVILAVAIILLLVAFFLPFSRRSGARDAARRVQCRNNLKQIALAIHAYAEEQGSYPPPFTVDADGNPLHSWRTLILPFLEEKSRYDKVNWDQPWNSPENMALLEPIPNVYACPSFHGTCPFLILENL